MELPSEKIEKEAEIKTGFKESAEETLKEVGPAERPSEIQKPKYKIFPLKGKEREEAIRLTKSETLKEIEEILIEGLDRYYYQSLPEVLKEQFKRRGEETASKIEKIIESAKVAVGKIFNLIINWLKMIPGINKFFIEQEAKIKTDKILTLAEKRKREKLS